MLLILLLISLTIQKNDYDLLLEWGKNHSLEISNKLEMKYISENNKTFIVKDKILKNEIILSIPNSILLNIENSLKLYGKKAQKLYKEYKSKCTNFKNDFMCDQSFLSYMMYRVNKNNKTKNNDFYKYYQYLFNTFESNLDSFPLFYNREQLYLIQFTSFSYSIEYIKKIYAGEIDIFENDLNLKKIRKEDYYVFRTYASSKSFNISGHSVIVPFVDMFDKHPIKYNLRIEATDSVTKIIATKDILPLETLYIKFDTLTNQNALALFGVTFDEIIDKITSFHVPILNPLFLKNNNIKINNSNFKKYFSLYMDIKKDKFYNEFLETYKQISIDLNKDKTEISVLKIILENLETLKLLNDAINSSHIYKAFYQQKDIDNILRIFKGEKKVLNDKINLMKNVINEYEKESKNKMNIDL